MKLLLAGLLASAALAGPALADNQSSNSSSNSSNGIHTRSDLYRVDDDRGRRIYERRSYRSDRGYSERGSRRGREDDEDDD